ncbi:MAG: roadblock/LC7 domain-containing protein [Gemmatimonadetes bacterium]|jgi:predicted regulator of Ras-like GTPase activity (Roadblock/LC7/MglB family)|nr:roadblock/LC7 domain-containing protein [Gemmatimonadota bacterium]TDJ54582.1 MAG: roadblock/LC7 domain-containing protein [Gemmatimonadota bacterium]
MRALEPWVEQPLMTFLTESEARLTLLMTSAGQVVAQHGFTRAVDIMSAAALGAAIVSSTEEMARVLGVRPFRALTHQGESHGIFLSAFETPRGRWIGLVVYGQDTSLGLVQLFFDRMVDELTQGVPAEGGTKQVLAQDFESELHSSLRALFGR